MLVATNRHDCDVYALCSCFLVFLKKSYMVNKYPRVCKIDMIYYDYQNLGEDGKFSNYIWLPVLKI